MSYERQPEHKRPYEDRLTDEAWAIASTRRSYEATGRVWKPWVLNEAVFRVADALAGKKDERHLDIPSEEDYSYAKERVDGKIEYSRRNLFLLRKAKLIHSPLEPDPKFINPLRVSLHTSWNGMRHGLSVDEFFYLAGISEDQLWSIFKFDPENSPHTTYPTDVFSGFVDGGQQQLADIIGRPIAYLQERKTRWGHRWDLSSRVVLTPSSQT